MSKTLHLLQKSFTIEKARPRTAPVNFSENRKETKRKLCFISPSAYIIIYENLSDYKLISDKESSFFIQSLVSITPLIVITLEIPALIIILLHIEQGSASLS